MYEAELVKTHSNGGGEVEITWVVNYDWSPLRPATHLSPGEGGAELDGEVYPCEVTYYPAEGDIFTIDRIQEGSLLALLLVGKYGPPDEVELWEAVWQHEEGLE